MSKELNCMNCSIGDFKHELCDCDNGFCKEFKGIGTQEDFFNAVMQRIRSQWIPVSERLPKVGEYVLASVHDDYADHNIIINKYEEQVFWSNGRITAWQPLPEPYKGGDKE